MPANDCQPTRHDVEFNQEQDAYATGWIDELQWLAVRFSDYGITPDLAALTLVEAWGLFLFLSNVAAGEAHA